MDLHPAERCQVPGMSGGNDGGLPREGGDRREGGEEQSIPCGQGWRDWGCLGREAPWRAQQRRGQPGELQELNLIASLTPPIPRKGFVSPSRPASRPEELINPCPSGLGKQEGLGTACCSLFPSFHKNLPVRRGSRELPPLRCWVHLSALLSVCLSLSWPRGRAQRLQVGLGQLLPPVPCPTPQFPAPFPNCLFCTPIIFSTPQFPSPFPNPFLHSQFSAPLPIPFSTPQFPAPFPSSLPRAGIPGEQSLDAGAVIEHPRRRALIPENPFIPLPQPRDAGRHQSLEALEKSRPSLVPVLGCSNERIWQHQHRDQHSQDPSASVQLQHPHGGSLGCGTCLEPGAGEIPRVPTPHPEGAEEADSGSPELSWPLSLSDIPTPCAVQQELHPAGITPCRNYTRQRRQPKANTIF